jgi:hypothetical protein
MVDTLNHPDLPLSPTRWRCLPAPQTLMRIRKAKLLPRDEVGWISRNRLDSGRCLSLFLDIHFYRTHIPRSRILLTGPDISWYRQPDGSRIAMLLRDRERARRLLSIYAVEAQRRNGILPTNWRQTWLKAASSASDDSTDAFWGNWLAYTSCIARDDCESGAVHLERCLQVSCSLPGAMRDFAAQQAAYFAGRFRSDTALALKWVKQTGRWDLRKIRFAEAPRKVQLPLSPRPLNKWSEWT